MMAMFRGIRHFISNTCQVTRKIDSQYASPFRISLLDARKDFLPVFDQKSLIHVCAPRMKDYRNMEKRRNVLAVNKVQGIVVGEEHMGMDMHIKSDIFPTSDLPYRLFNEIPFKDLPIVHVKTTKNNTIICLTEKSIKKFSTSCGQEGFKNTKKGTNIAAQVTGTSFGIKALKRGFKTVKVLIQGIGPGRVSALKGLQLGGLEIVSITDRTIDRTQVRPKKKRRI